MVKIVRRFCCKWDFWFPFLSKVFLVFLISILLAQVHKVFFLCSHVSLYRDFLSLWNLMVIFWSSWSAHWYSKPHWPTNDQLVVLISTQEGQSVFWASKSLFASEILIYKRIPESKRETPLLILPKTTDAMSQYPGKTKSPKITVKQPDEGLDLQNPSGSCGGDRSWWGRLINPATWSDISRILRHNSLTKNHPRWWNFKVSLNIKELMGCLD